MENIKRIVCQYNPKIVTSQKSLEHRAGTNAFVQILLDEEPKEKMEYQCRKNHKRKHDKCNHQNNGMQVILHHGDNLVFLDNVDKIERSVRKRSHHIDKLTVIRIRFFIS